MPGRLLHLNGTSSAGKTSLGQALQAALAPEVWLLLGVDTFLSTLPHHAFFRPEGVSFVHGRVVTGPIFQEGYQRFRAAVVGMVAAGADVIVDDVLLDGGDEQQRWLSVLVDQPVPVRWVRVDCDVEVAAAREQARGDRTIGMVRDQARRVHEGVAYDLRVDTTAAPADAVARDLLERVAWPA